FSTTLDEAPYQGDAVALDRVVTNLLSNAIKYSPPGVPVEVRLDRANGPIYMISVTDRGPGIPEQSLPHLFEPFFQAPGTTKAGLGLGLFIVNTIAVLHGGSIEVETRPDQGTTMT